MSNDIPSPSHQSLSTTLKMQVVSCCRFFISSPSTAPLTPPSLPTPAVPTTDDDSPSDYRTLFTSQRQQTTCPTPLHLVTGSVPRDFPRGRYYLLGPGIFSDDRGCTVHPLDGHGYLRCFDFAATAGPRGGVSYSARYVETEALRRERCPATGAWEFVYRGVFSALRRRGRGARGVMKNVANTGVVCWGGRALCFWEGGAGPYEVDPLSLATVGEFGEFERTPAAGIGSGGAGWWGMVDVAAAVLKPVLYGLFEMPEKRMLSHYKIDPRRERLIVLSCNAEDMLLPVSHFTFHEYDKNFKLVHARAFTIPDHLMVHDWAFTDGHYVILANRIKFDFPGSVAAASGTAPMISALAADPSRPTSPVYLLPRFSTSGAGSRDWREPIRAPAQLWFLHVANAFEEVDGDGSLRVRVQASACSYLWFDFRRMFGYDWRSGGLDPSYMNGATEGSASAGAGSDQQLLHLVEVSVRLGPRGSYEECTVRRVAGLCGTADFPTVNPDFAGRRNAHVYAAAASGRRRSLPHFPFDSVAKVDFSSGSVAMWSAGGRRFVGEPVFVSKGGGGGGEDDGYVLTVEYVVSERKCCLVILDAKRIGSDEAMVARLEVPKCLNFPLGFHGFWAGI